MILVIISASLVTYFLLKEVKRIENAPGYYVDNSIERIDVDF